MTFFEEAVEKIKIRQYNRRGLILYKTDVKKEFYFTVQVCSRISLFPSILIIFLMIITNL